MGAFDAFPTLDVTAIAVGGDQAKWESGITPSVRATTAAMKILRADGYEVVFRHEGFCDCFITRDDEKWVGRGRDDVQALADALRQMFPSRLAWKLLGTRVAEASPATKNVDEVASAAHAAPAAIPATPVVAAQPKLEPVATTKTGSPSALDAIAELRKEIEQSRGHLARLAPSRQRLRIQAWMCRARAEQEKRPASGDLVRAVALVARELATICKLYWPGSVRALQSGTSPSVIAARASTWAEAAVHANALDLPDPSAKLDPDGWADGEKLLPPPPRPEVVLHDVVGLLDKITGPLGATQPRMHAPPTPGSPDVLLAAAKLRWLRNAAPDVERWAQAMGRMRWLAAESGQAALQSRLDPMFVPRSSWDEAIRTGRF